MIGKPVDQLLHAVRRRDRAAHFRSRRPVCVQMIGQCGAAKYQTRAQPFWITGINPTQHGNQKIIRRSFSQHAASPFGNRFELPRTQTGGARRESHAKIEDVGDIERELSRLTAKDESFASVAPRGQQRHSDVGAERFQSRRIEQAVGRGLNQSMRRLNCFD